jgi:hypothetical protein
MFKLMPRFLICWMKAMIEWPGLNIRFPAIKPIDRPVLPAALFLSRPCALFYLEFFSSAVWQVKQYLQAMALRRLSGIRSPHSSHSIADSPV